MVTLAMLARAFIGFGATAFLMAITGADTGLGPCRQLGGLAISLQLVLCIKGGAALAWRCAHLGEKS